MFVNVILERGKQILYIFRYFTERLSEAWFNSKQVPKLIYDGTHQKIGIGTYLKACFSQIICEMCYFKVFVILPQVK